MHVAVPPSALRFPAPRKRLVSRTAARSAANVLVWMALVLSLPRRASASATPGDTVIPARLPPPARGSWESDYLCTAVTLPADPLKLVKVVLLGLPRAPREKGEGGLDCRVWLLVHAASPNASPTAGKTSDPHKMVRTEFVTPSLCLRGR